MRRSEPSAEQVARRLVALRRLAGLAPALAAVPELPDRDLSAEAVARRLDELRALCELADWARALRRGRSSS